MGSAIYERSERKWSRNRWRIDEDPEKLVLGWWEDSLKLLRFTCTPWCQTYFDAGELKPKIVFDNIDSACTIVQTITFFDAAVIELESSNPLLERSWDLGRQPFKKYMVLADRYEMHY